MIVDFGNMKEIASNLFRAKKKEHWQANAELWSQSITEDRLRAGCFETIVDHIARSFSDAPPRCVADLGCGDGRFFQVVGNRLPSWSCVGYDDCPSMLAIAGQRCAGLNAEFAQWDFEDRVGPPQASFDVVTANFSLLECVYLDTAIRNATALVREGGLFIVTVLEPLREIIRISEKRSNGLVTEIELTEQHEVVLWSLFNVQGGQSRLPYPRIIRMTETYLAHVFACGFCLTGIASVDGPFVSDYSPRASILLFSRRSPA